MFREGGNHTLGSRPSTKILGGVALGGAANAFPGDSDQHDAHPRCGPGGQDHHRRGLGRLKKSSYNSMSKRREEQKTAPRFPKSNARSINGSSKTDVAQLLCDE